MNINFQLIRSMAEQCRGVIVQSEPGASELPEALHPKHLLWMCDKVRQHASDWPETRLHRWIGFVQCGMMANGMLDLNEAKVMFEAVKDAHDKRNEDQDLIDHLDPSCSFEIEIGGSG